MTYEFGDSSVDVFGDFVLVRFSITFLSSRIREVCPPGVMLIYPLCAGHVADLR